MAFGDNKPWLKNYAPGVRPHLDYPNIPLYQFLDDAVANYPDVPATIFAGSTLTYKQLGDQVDRMASALSDMGVQKGDRVSILLPNCPQLVVAYYGILKVGAIVVQTNPMYMERELEYLLNNSGAETIILLDTFYPRLQNVKGQTAVKNVIVVNSAPGAGLTNGGAIVFDDLLAKSDPVSPSLQVDPQNDMALLQYTGGTTGVSKGTMLTHFNLVVNTLQTREAIAGDCRMGQEKILVTLPLFHAYGTTVGMNLALSIAGTQILLPRFEIESVLQAINDYKPTFFPGAPTMYVAIIRHPRLKEFDISSIKTSISVSAPLPVEVADRFEALTGGHALVFVDELDPL